MINDEGGISNDNAPSCVGRFIDDLRLGCCFFAAGAAVDDDDDAAASLALFAALVLLPLDALELERRWPFVLPPAPADLDAPLLLALLNLLPPAVAAPVAAEGDFSLFLFPGTGPRRFAGE